LGLKFEEITERKFFVDMDGVIANCELGICDEIGITLDTFTRSSNEQKEAYWSEAKKNADIESFFANLHWLPKGKNLLKFLDDRNINYTFLTRPSGGSTTAACIRGKRQWLKKHGLDNHEVIFAFAKEKHAHKGDVLIDDLPANISDWNSVGGIGLLYSEERQARIFELIEELL